MNSKPTVISLFAGGGGSSLGYQLAGFKELLAVEMDKNAIETLKLNFPGLTIFDRDVALLTGDEALRLAGIKKGQLDVLDGSPPCQGFSTAGKRKVTDGRNVLFEHFARLVEELQPKAFVMENVTGMVKGTMKGMFLEILRKLKATGYAVKCKQLNSKWYNVPQARERLIFIGIRSDIKKEYAWPGRSEIISFKQATKGLKNQTAPELSKFIRDVVPKMKPGQCCDDVVPGMGGFQTVRIYADRPCPTITKMIASVGFGALIHPTENRVLSIGEMKRCTTFPDEYTFLGRYQDQKARIGNSVPPNMMKAIAENLLPIVKK